MCKKAKKEKKTECRRLTNRLIEKEESKKKKSTEETGKSKYLKKIIYERPNMYICVSIKNVYDQFFFIGKQKKKISICYKIIIEIHLHKLYRKVWR